MDTMLAWRAVGRLLDVKNQCRHLLIRHGAELTPRQWRLVNARHNRATDECIAARDAIWAYVLRR